MFYQTDPYLELVNEDQGTYLDGGYVSDRTVRLSQQCMAAMNGALSDSEEFMFQAA